MCAKISSAALLLCMLAVSCGGGEPEQEERAPEVVKVTDYHDNGMLSKRGVTIDGKRHGQWESFYPSGLRWSETTFKDGVREGPTVTYFPNGMMRYAGFYHDDVRSGKWIFYDTTGAVITRIDMDVNPHGADSLFREMLRRP